MKSFKIILGLTAVILASFLFIPENNTPIDFNSVYKAPSESPKARKSWDAKRLTNSQGVVPKNIRTKELRFAQSLPNDLNNSNLTWTAEGPYNVGGRTRALAYDVTDESILICLLYTSPSPRDRLLSRMPSSA